MTARRRKEKEGASFEERLGALQEIVAALEDGDLPLLESIEKYRAGIAALKDCRALLDAARGTVEMLSRDAAAAPALAASAPVGEHAEDEDGAEDEESDDDAEEGANGAGR
jgi:exodeoxyribonuclease VII small subunit